MSSRRSRPRLLPIFPSALALLLCVMAGGCSRPEPDPPSVILISIDTLRPDRLSCYGATRRTSPAIDSLAARGVRFDRAFTPAPWTLPAHASMLSGYYPGSLAAKSGGKQLYGAAPQLSSLLAEHGYATAAVTGGGFVSSEFGADSGFQSFEEGSVVDAIRWLEDAPEPFFLFFHSYAPHVPYSDRRYVGAESRTRFEEIYLGERERWWEEHIDLCCRALPVEPEEREYIQALYDGGVAFADDMVAALLRSLEAKGATERTLIVFTSDHGEEFWEHTGRGAYHGHTLYDELAHVPLIWVDPASTPARRDVSADVNLVDIVPTLLARLGLSAAAPLDGVDLGPLLDGESWDLERPLFADFTRHGPPRHSVRTREAKLILTPDPEIQRNEGALFAVPVLAEQELYLADDPRELNNVAASHPELTVSLLELLLARRQASKSMSFEEPEEVDAATLERLRSLGYVK